MTTGDRIRRRLLELGLSQSELARRVELTQPTINALIRGSSRSSAYLHRIARELRTTSAYLAGETDDPASDDPDFDPLTGDETELLDLFRGLEKKEQTAIMTLARSIATNARSPTVHDKGQAYRGSQHP